MRWSRYKETNHFRLLQTRGVSLELTEEVGEEARVTVQPQHVGAVRVDDGQAAVPEGVFGLLYQEWLGRGRG